MLIITSSAVVLTADDGVRGGHGHASHVGELEEGGGRDQGAHHSELEEACRMGMCEEKKRFRMR